MPTEARERPTLEAFLAWERDATGTEHELIDGSVHAREPVDPLELRLITRLRTAIESRLRPGFVLRADHRIVAAHPTHPNAFMPDLAVLGPDGSLHTTIEVGRREGGRSGPLERA